jgi:hypothetical protein
MYYLELIQKFWNFNQKAKLDTKVITVYFYLLNLANDCGSYMVSISDRNFSRTLGLSRNSIMAARKKLQSLGIIQYNKDTTSLATYRLLLDYDEEVLTSESIQIDAFLSGVLTRNEEAIDTDPPALTSITSDGDQKKIDENGPAGNNIPEPAIKSTGQPYLDVFLEYARTLEGYESTLDHKITEKYRSWEKNGWNSVSGRPITDWKSSLKSQMPFLKTAAAKDLSLTSISRIKRP